MLLYFEFDANADIILQGLWGSVAMLFVLLPIVYFIPGAEGHGLHENTVDTIYVRRPNHCVWC